MHTHVRLLAQTYRHYYAGATPDLPEVHGAIVAALLGTALSTIQWLPIGIVCIALLVLMSIEILTEYMGMAPQEREVYLWEREAIGKVLLFFLVIVSMVGDAVMYAVGQYLGKPILMKGYMFLTFTSALWLIGAQVAKITVNIAKAEGKEQIPPTLEFFSRHVRWIIKSLRRVDEQRMEKAGIPIDNKSRLVDKFTEDELAEALSIVLAKRADPAKVLEAQATQKEEKHDDERKVGDREAPGSSGLRDHNGDRDVPG